MTIQEHAQKRMLQGSKEHPDQSWEELDPIPEFLEEIVDAYNYIGHSKVPEERSIWAKRMLEFLYDKFNSPQQ